MIPSRTELAAHLGRLAETLSELKCRVADAVATETGKAVAAAVKDLLTAALTGRPEPAREYQDYRHPDPDGYWDDEPDDFDRSEPGPQSSPPPVRPDWPAAARVASLAAKAWAGGRLAGWVAAGVGLLAGLAAVAGGPIPHAGLSLAATVADLFPHLASLPF